MRKGYLTISKRFMLDECNIILETEIPDLLNKSWQYLLNGHAKLEALRQHKIVFADWRRLIDSLERNFHTKMKNASNENPQLQPQSQSMQSAPASNLSVGAQGNSTTLPYNEGQLGNENVPATEKEKKQKEHDKALLKINADFQADCLVQEKKLERIRNELGKQLEELEKSHLSFTEERDRVCYAKEMLKLGYFLQQ